ncbi:hypothetical protein [Wenxinia saemankumensis]|uniref:DUF4189 domain-containing protein n=1 Tax=Wenxinia saemankumensis TaxID=1447782 RepID=A0A1M6EHA2_9RHOB|nr:hypothetical protein [Wenxinia saemankumensis]SHI84856.1 hypothetical protein SAMN05444417_1999 [Wenxinia saemankumensis]
MTTRDRRGHGAALALLAALLPAISAAQDAVPSERAIVYPPSGELRILSGLTLSPEAQDAFDQQFRANTYFSAFAYAKNGGWGYATTGNSLEGARAVAIAECENANDDCILIAEIVPRGYRDPQPGDVTMTPAVYTYLFDPDAAGAPEGAPRAFAVGPDGAYALVWGQPSQEAANRAALADCNGYVRTEPPGLPPLPCVLVPGLPGTN